MEFRLGGLLRDAQRLRLSHGIRRTLQNVRPRPDQPYQTMQLAQFNWFLDKGLITADPNTARLTIHYDKYPEAVSSLLEEVLRDLTHISQASVETGADAEEEEQAYAGIIEYVRAGVQLIHDELIELRAAGDTPPDPSRLN